MMLNKMARLVREEEGQGMAEYGLILAGVAVVAIVGFKALGVEVDKLIDTVTSKL